jgi:hypothetical protein
LFLPLEHLGLRRVSRPWQAEREWVQVGFLDAAQPVQDYCMPFTHPAQGLIVRTSRCLAPGDNVGELCLGSFCVPVPEQGLGTT